MSTVRTGAGTWAIATYDSNPNYAYEDAANSCHGSWEAPPLTIFSNFQVGGSYEYDYDFDDGALEAQIFQAYMQMVIDLTGFAGSISFQQTSSLLGNQFEQLAERDLAFNYPNRTFEFLYPVERE